MTTLQKALWGAGYAVLSHQADTRKLGQTTNKLRRSSEKDESWADEPVVCPQFPVKSAKATSSSWRKMKITAGAVPKVILGFRASADRGDYFLRKYDVY